MLFVFTWEDFSNNKNITRDNRQRSVFFFVFFLHSRTSAVIKLLLRITGRVFVFWDLSFKKLLQKFLRKSLSFKIIVWNYSELNHEIICCSRLVGIEKRLTNQDYRLTLKTIMLLQTSKHLKMQHVEIWKSQKRKFRNTRRFSILVQKGFNAEFIRLYLDQFFWAIIVYRLD